MSRLKKTSGSQRYTERRQEMSMGAITLITAVVGVARKCKPGDRRNVVSPDRSRLEVYHDIRQDEQSRIKLAVDDSPRAMSSSIRLLRNTAGAYLLHVSVTQPSASWILNGRRSRELLL
jgi:hypothetical protein